MTDATQGVTSDPVSELWMRVRSQLSASLPESTYRMWLAPLVPAGRRADTLFLHAPDSVRTWVERRYGGLILHALRGVDDSVSAVSFQTPPDTEMRSGDAVPAAATPNPTHVFDRFVIGPGNHLAHAAALAVAEAPSEAYNPLFLHGDPGLGKTHLLGAIANYLRRHVPELTVRFTNAEAFTAEFVSALRENGTAEFKRRYRDLDVLLIDDIQFIAGKPHTEEEFFHTFNALYEAGSQIVLSADRSPSGISTLTDRLADRFEWGLTAELVNPDLATRLSVLRHLVAEAGLDSGDQEEALALLARRVQTNLRQLRGALTRAVAEASLHSMPLDPGLVARVFPAVREPDVHVTPESIRTKTAAHFNTDIQTLESRKRDKRTATARSVAMFLTREMTDLSFPQIGSLYGGRDHSTVISSIDRISSMLSVDAEVTTAVDKLRATLHSDPAG
jgi:chromosomal replication initiator protein